MELTLQNEHSRQENNRQKENQAPKVLVFGNSGSGKSTLANKLCISHSLAHLDLDTLAWLPDTPPKRSPLDFSVKQIDKFIQANTRWVIEGCYADLLKTVVTQADELVFMDLDIHQCQDNARARAWEPHKYASKQAQDENLDMLLQWIEDYSCRSDAFSYQAHKMIFDEFKGEKTRYTDNPE